MTIPFWCLLVVVLVPFVLAGLAGYFKLNQLGRLDNNHPRQQAAELAGPGARAWAAQQNAWEALAVFAPAVIVAHLAGADPRLSAMAAEGFVACRVLHAVFYVADLAALRSLIFMCGFGCCLWLFGLAARA